MLKNTDTTFGLVSRANHWLSAILFIALIALGIYMEGLPKSPDKYELYDLHKSLAVGLMALIVLRFIWLKLSPNPAQLSANKTEHILGHSVKGILYLALIIVPMSGWIMSNSGGHEVSFFGLFNLPQIVEESEAINEIAKTIHGLTPLIILVILLHVAGALKHHFVYKDNTLLRMLGRKRKETTE